MKTLFLATAAFAALVMIAPIGTAHATDGDAFWEAKKLAEIAHTLDAACTADGSDPYADGTTCRARVDAYSLLYAKGWCLGSEAWDKGKWRKCTKKELADIKWSHEPRVGMPTEDRN